MSGMRSSRTQPSPPSQVTICHHLALGLPPPCGTHGGTHILRVGNYGPPDPLGANSPLLVPMSVKHIIVSSVVSMVWYV